ncbi:MAG: hypothetical protein ABSG25_11365 [Bryobacteraceae bacterium]
MRFVLDEEHKEIVVMKLKPVDAETFKNRYQLLGHIIVNKYQYSIHTNKQNNYIVFTNGKNWYKTSSMYLNDIVMGGEYRII